jgi:pyruvate/2-oxoglutarate dehydrogenase complex dihydrolipoamide acyltransferase (E2) component
MKWLNRMQTPIILPDLGAGAMTLSVWFADVGDQVFEGERLAEVLLEGATFDVPAPTTGRLIEKRALPRDVIRAAQTLGILERES